ncbi:MAG: alpha-amylase family glycosyl hydrolase, partial [Acidimicrobiales bacterium]
MSGATPREGVDLRRAGLGPTYRVQLHAGFGFADAAGIVPYLSRLGIATVYLSPIAEAVPGSAHGYDGVDPTRLRGELGGDGAFGVLVEACGAHGLGICVDHVPNHLAAWAGGGWWRALLSEGPDSFMGEVFDVDWDAAVPFPAGTPGAPRRTVTLPLLDRPLDVALREGRVRLAVRGGDPVIALGEPGEAGVDLPVTGGAVRPGEDLADVLAHQHYQLVDWHDAAERNYRRFFDIDGLAGVRVEAAEVFDATHALLFSLVETGKLSAIRIDHVDGLREPAAYLRRLAARTGLPIVVEKILTGDEQLRPDWPVTGTTGYETIDDVGGVLVDPHGYDRLVAAGRAEGDDEVEPLTVRTRRLVATTSFPGEVARCAARLKVHADALRELVVHLPRYRTYLDDTGGDAESEETAVWRRAASLAAAATALAGAG